MHSSSETQATDLNLQPRMYGTHVNCSKKSYAHTGTCTYMYMYMYMYIYIYMCIYMYMSIKLL